jgi:pyruvate/2-oxoglutarate dehydrogenase complex dihydrolipoamide dehydrogenase (E3) component
VTFTDPELAQVGLTEAEAVARHGARLEVVTVPLTEVDRAVAEGQTDGFARVMVVRGRPVGATILAPQAGELIAVWAMAIANRMSMAAIAAAVVPYPTFGDVNKRVAAAYLGRRLFGSAGVKRVARLVQRWLP